MTVRTAKSKAAQNIGWNKVKGGVTAPNGYLAAGIASGIKENGLDLAVIVSSQPASAAGVFTQNRVQVAPVVLSKQYLKLSKGRMQAILINSGCANACTGAQGLRDSRASARYLASHLDLDPHRILIASTGVIGSFLPMPKIEKGISSAVSSLSPRGGTAAARAIMTTDTRAKVFAVEGRIAGKTVRIGGIAKGAGMIHPQMATMLAAITTDAKVPPANLNRLLRRAVDPTFNCLTVDGDTSTNDAVMILANGTSGAALTDVRSRSFFEKGLTIVCEELAKSIARDGEGATKFVEVVVSGSSSFQAARKVAMAIARSSLVKTALYGQEFNWGRILAAVGYAGVPFNPDRVILSLNGIPIFRNGSPISSTQARAMKAMKARNIRIEVDLGGKRASARVWTCDLSHEYVNINATYIS
jgi:glutamate N-acetyltransferase/amino-acid N-acetyltransferase